MNLAKPYIDVGLYCRDREAVTAFWQQEVGLAFESLLKLGGGAQQWRHDLSGSILKINHQRDGLLDAVASGYDGIVVADETVDEPVTMTDPEGNRVTLVQPGFEGIDQIAVEMAVADPALHATFMRRVLGCQEISSRHLKWGETSFYLSQKRDSDGHAGSQRRIGPESPPDFVTSRYRSGMSTSNTKLLFEVARLRRCRPRRSGKRQEFRSSRIPTAIGLSYRSVPH